MAAKKTGKQPQKRAIEDVPEDDNEVPDDIHSGV